MAKTRIALRSIRATNRFLHEQGPTMILRQDHIAGGIFVVAGIAVFAMSGDLPLGSMAMPGAGMMPKLVLGLMAIFGLVLMVRAGESPPFATIAWNDLPHAVCVTMTTA